MPGTRYRTGVSLEARHGRRIATRRRGLAFIAPAAVLAAACAAAIPDGSAQDGWIGQPLSGPAIDAGLPECPHGRLEDPHRGFVRCLEPGEADAGWLPPSPQPEDAGTVDAAPLDAGPIDAGAVPDAAPLAPAPLVEAGEPAFENGDVPKLDKALAKLTSGIATCVSEHGGLSAASGSMKVQFLVRARGRAEGVEILASKGVGKDAEECVRVLLKNRSVGAPSADPVGVTVSFVLKASSR